MTRQLYPHQERTLAMLRQSIAGGHRRPLVCSPTGSGKGVVKATITRGGLAKNNGVLVTVPSITLVDQMVRMLASEGVHEVGVMQADHALTAPLMPVQVVSLQTLMRRDMAEPGIVLVDEAHVMFKHLAELMQLWRNAIWIGWTATPGTRGLGALYDDLVIPTTVEELIDSGHLAPFTAFAPSHPDLSGIKAVAGDYHEGQLSERMRGAHLVADVVGTWFMQARGRPTLVFAVDRAHAKVLQESFVAAGVRTEYVDASTSREERDSIRQRMEAGEIEVVCNIGCLTTGCDWPFVSCIVLARPTKSAMLYVQIVGRGLRTHPGKDRCIVLDHSSTSSRLGLVTDISWGPLDDGQPNTSGKRHKDPVAPAECFECHALFRGNRRCPECGHELKVISNVQVEDGELVELRRTKATMADKQEWYSQLLGFGEQRGYKRGWVAHTYRTKFGEWPSRLAELAKDPSPEVRNYVRHRLIAHAKAQPGKEAA
jgi:DNA repair protein RadD